MTGRAAFVVRVVALAGCSAQTLSTASREGQGIGRLTAATRLSRTGSGVAGASATTCSIKLDAGSLQVAHQSS
jgi:hypothetical protein